MPADCAAGAALDRAVPLRLRGSRRVTCAATIAHAATLAQAAAAAALAASGEHGRRYRSERHQARRVRCRPAASDRRDARWRCRWWRTARCERGGRVHAARGALRHTRRAARALLLRRALLVAQVARRGRASLMEGSADGLVDARIGLDLSDSTDAPPGLERPQAAIA